MKKMTSSKALLSSVVVSCTVLLTFVFGACTEKPPGYYEDDQNAFSVVFPPGWSHQSDSGTVALVAWRGERNDSAPTVVIVVRDVPEQATNENFADLNFREIASEHGYTLKEERVAIDGDSVTARTYAYQIDGRWRQGMTASLVSDEHRGYVLHCASLPERFQGDKDDYMKILRSFKRE